METNRKENFKRNSDLEILLNDINTSLYISEEEILRTVNEQKYPLVFIMGPHRSGTTLMLQWLAATEQIAYPTNMLSRFYGVPVIGAKIQKLLTDEKYNFRNEIMDFNSEYTYSSENGKTKGALSPNEFWYFWRRFIKYDSEIEYVQNEKLQRQHDMKILHDELVGVTEVFGKPFALKGMICNYNIEVLDKLFDKALFIYMKRNPYTNIESAIKARERQSGSIDEWYSFKIPEYYDLMKIENPIKQVAGQIYSINRAVEKGLSGVCDDRKLVVSYEEFCQNPKKYYELIAEKLLAQGCRVSTTYKGQERFDVSRSDVDLNIKKYYDEYVNELKGI